MTILAVDGILRTVVTTGQLVGSTRKKRQCHLAVGRLGSMPHFQIGSYDWSFSHRERKPAETSPLQLLPSLAQSKRILQAESRGLTESLLQGSFSVAPLPNASAKYPSLSFTSLLSRHRLVRRRDTLTRVRRMCPSRPWTQLHSCAT